MSSQARRGFDRAKVVTPNVSPLQALNIAVGAAEADRVYEISLSDLIVDEDVQVRVDGLDEDTVLAYVAILENGGKLDPITVIRVESGDHYVADGFHRVEAHIRVGRAGIQAKVIDGDRDTALDFSEEGNLKHGRQLSNKDKKNVLWRRMERNGHPWQIMSNGDLAKALGVSKPTISEWLKELATVRNLTVERSQVIGGDGRLINTGNIKAANEARQTAPATPTQKPDDYKPLTPEERQGLAAKRVVSEPQSYEQQLIQAHFHPQPNQDLPPGYSYADLGLGEDEFVPETPEIAARVREAKIRLSTQAIFESVIALLENKDAEILKELDAQVAFDLGKAMLDAIEHEFKLFDQVMKAFTDKDYPHNLRADRRTGLAMQEIVEGLQAVNKGEWLFAFTGNEERKSQALMFIRYAHDCIRICEKLLKSLNGEGLNKYIIPELENLYLDTEKLGQVLSKKANS
jgi:hypothetical protein